MFLGGWVEKVSGTMLGGRRSLYDGCIRGCLIDGWIHRNSFWVYLCDTLTKLAADICTTYSCTGHT